MSIPGELDNARRLAFAADEARARDLLLSLVPRIEREGRDDLMLEVLAQLGEIYLARGQYDGVRESVRRIRDCLERYAGMVSDPDTAHMTHRYSRRAQFLQAGLAAALGDHERAAAALTALCDAASDTAPGDLADEQAEEHAYLCGSARVLCASALCDDDLHVDSVPLWEQALAALDRFRQGGEFADHLLVTTGTAYGRFCVETGRLPEAELWLRRAGARAQARGWGLANARTQLERAAACWSVGDHATTEQLVSEAQPVIAAYARAHDTARCWLFLGLIRLGSGALEAADECWEHAERLWRELGKPLPLHRILLQRSWIAIFWSRFAEAVELIAQARELLDSSPRSSWLQYAQLDSHLGTVWRADALADLGFDSSGDPEEPLQETEARQAEGLGILTGEVGTPEYRRAMTKLEQAAELKVPAALAVDSVRYSIADADARSRWAKSVSAPMLAGAFAVAWEWENTQLISELVEYHSARGTFDTELQRPAVGEWASAAAAAVLIDADSRPAIEPAPALAAGGPPARAGGSLGRLGPLPPLQMQPDSPPIMSHYRTLAFARYGRAVTAPEPAWRTWP